ncbi:hypothetical protein [Arthrobacter sp. G119Y2]|uniref:hypothetical protein n=1 Tax=Arthrobacter sp. G119Y2 TaxID=3134965 RepID=UPI00311A55D3
MLKGKRVLKETQAVKKTQAAQKKNWVMKKESWSVRGMEQLRFRQWCRRKD